MLEEASSGSWTYDTTGLSYSALVTIVICISCCKL